MFQKYRNFIRGVSSNWLSRIGAALATSTFFIFLLLEALRFIGAITNAYIGLVTYLLFPLLFIIGLALIPIGWRKYVRQSGKTAKELLAQRFDEGEVKGGILGAKLLRTVGLLTLINVVFLGFVTSRTLHFMDQPNFCGTACHQAMNPEWVTYQQSPHARVKCVECHVGEGFDALLDSKINGVWQIISLTLDLYEKPIPTPVKNLRPARETCEKCHWPQKFLGDRLRTIVHYNFDQESSPRYTTLNLKIGSGQEGLDAGSHWHIAEKNTVRYLPADDERMNILWVELKQADGSYKRFTNESLENQEPPKKQKPRIMDCVDCHNRATHIYESPENALDLRISRGILSKDLPYIKREGLEALTKNYPDTTEALAYIEKRLKRYYAVNYPEIAVRDSVLIDSAISALKETYSRNIHPYMKIIWGSYPNHLGHRSSPGCFRCHSPYMVDAEGKAVSDDCTLCHSILAFESEEPFEYFHDPGAGDLEKQMHLYLRGEFMESLK